MDTIIRKNDKNAVTTAIFIFLIILIITVVIIGIWVLFLKPAIDAYNDIKPNKPVECTIAPTRPVILSINIVDNSAVVSWDSVTNTDRYVLHISKNQGFNVSNSERSITLYDTKITVINLLPVTYYFKLQAINSCGSSNPSNEKSVTITTYPEKFKICKRNDPTFCILVPSDNGFKCRISTECQGSQCDLSTTGQTISLYPGGARCVQENNDGGTPIESYITSQTCNGSSSQNWSFNFDTGRIQSSSGYCLGGNNVPESSAFNTSCSVVSSTDSRYQWDVIPIQ